MIWATAMHKALYWGGQNAGLKIMIGKVLQNNIVNFPFVSFSVEETKMFSITILMANDSWINFAIS